MKISKKFFLSAFVLLLMASVVIAQTINTHIIFVVPSVISFRVVMPGTPLGFNNTIQAENNTVDIAFNSSANISVWGTTSIMGLNASIRGDPTLVQSDTTGIFNYTNTGNTYINITLYLQNVLPWNWSGTCCVNNSIRLYAMNRTPAASAAIPPAQPCVHPGNILADNNTCIYINTTAAGESGSGGSMIWKNAPPAATNSTYLWADFINLSVSQTEVNLTHNVTGV